MFFLPPYRAEFNSDERVRSAMKRNAVDRVKLDGSRQLRHAGVGRPRNLWRRPDRIRSLVRVSGICCASAAEGACVRPGNLDNNEVLVIISNNKSLS